MSSEFFQVPRPINKESPYFYISHIFLHLSFIFIFLGLRKMPSFMLGSGTWKNSKLPSRPWDLEKFLSSYSFIFLHTFFIIPSYFFIFSSHFFIFPPPIYYGLWDLEKIPSYLIYSHETCFYCPDLDGNFLILIASSSFWELFLYLVYY